MDSKILSAFKNIIDLEKVVEASRQELCLRPDFNTKDLFSAVDFKGKGLVGFGYFDCFLKQLKVGEKKHKFAPRLFEEFDLDKNEMLNFSEFEKMFLPKQNDHKKMQNAKESTMRKRVKVAKENLSNFSSANDWDSVRDFASTKGTIFSSLNSEAFQSLKKGASLEKSLKKNKKSKKRRKKKMERKEFSEVIFFLEVFHFGNTEINPKCDFETFGENKASFSGKNEERDESFGFGAFVP